MPRRYSHARTLQTQWNDLVPQARARGLNVNTWQNPPWTIAYGTERLTWLRSQLNLVAPVTAQMQVTTAMSPVAPVSIDLGAFTFGVEIECYMPVGSSRQGLATALTNAGIPTYVDAYGHAVPRQWKIVQDGSLDDYRRGVEVVSPPLRGDEGFRQVNLVCTTLKAYRCTVRRKAGLHVHIGAASEPPAFFRNLLKTYHRYESVIDSVLAESRRYGSIESNWCRPIRIANNTLFESARSVEEVATAVDQDSNRAYARSMRRYRKVNIQSYWLDGKTVEFRQHQGTVEAVKVLNWVKFCLRMALAARSGHHDDNIALTLDGLMNYLNASTEERVYFTARQVEFSRRITPRRSVA